MENATAKNQFVIQEHETPHGVHWDLMLEHEGALWTWRIGVHPSQIGQQPTAAERIADHPLKFLTYEGPVQKGTANVSIVDKGTVYFRKINTQIITLEFDGHFVNGIFTLLLEKVPFWTLLKSNA